MEINSNVLSRPTVNTDQTAPNKLGREPGRKCVKVLYKYVCCFANLLSIPCRKELWKQVHPAM